MPHTPGDKIYFEVYKNSSRKVTPRVVLYVRVVVYVISDAICMHCIEGSIFFCLPQIRGNIACPSPPSPLRFVPCIFIAKRLQPFLPSSTRVIGHTYCCCIPHTYTRIYAYVAYVYVLYLQLMSTYEHGHFLCFSYLSVLGGWPNITYA